MADPGRAKTTATTKSVLIGGWWKWGASVGNLIRFDPNGEGEISCGYDQQYFIYNKFDWKPSNEKDTLALQQTMVDNGIDIEFPTIEIEFTITNRRMDNFEQLGNQIKPDAFRPKRYTIKLSRGRFPVRDIESTDLCQWYTEHLHIDPSPYPPLEAWDDKEIAEALKFWERKDFYRTGIEGDEYFDPDTGRPRIELKEYYDGLHTKGGENNSGMS